VSAGEKGKTFEASLIITARLPLFVNVDKADSPFATGD